jgi:ADP-ribosyl-[dinitrogen reductase] hydrolase
MTGAWARDLVVDLEAIRSWKATSLISLLEPQEFEELRITALPTTADALGLRWYGLPITDGAAPDARFLSAWNQLGPKFIADIAQGNSLVIHCKGGLGRAGTVAAMLILDSGKAVSADDAMRLVRSVRPGAIETEAQEVFLRQWAKRCRHF